MKAIPPFLLCCLLVLFQSPLRADPPQPSPAPVLGNEELTWLGEQESFRIGVHVGQVPLIFDTGDGTLAGTYIDYLARLSGKLNVPIEPVTLARDSEAPEPVTDAILTTRLPDAQVTPGKRYSEPLMSLTYGLFVSAGDVAIRSLSDLEGGRIAIIDGDLSQYPMLDPVESFTPVPVDSIGDAVSRVLSGQADAFLGPVPVVSDYLQSAMISGIGLAALLEEARLMWCCRWTWTTTVCSTC